jgi:hypothetical protein
MDLTTTRSKLIPDPIVLNIKYVFSQLYAAMLLWLGRTLVQQLNTGSTMSITLVIPDSNPMDPVQQWSFVVSPNV